MAFGDRFPALFLLLWACPCTFVCLLLCTLFLSICAPGLSAVELYFFPSLWSAFSGGRLRRLIFAVLLRAPSGGGFGPSPFPVLSLAPRSALCFSGLLFSWALLFSSSLLRRFSLPFGPFFSSGPSLGPRPVFLLCPFFSSWYSFYPCFLSGSVLCFLVHLFCLVLLYFLSLCFLIFFYLFLFISICPPKGLRKGRVGVGTLSSGGCGKWVRPWGKHYFNPTLPYEGLKECMS